MKLRVTPAMEAGISAKTLGVAGTPGSRVTKCKQKGYFSYRKN
jgi:hypothetical protein